VYYRDNQGSELPDGTEVSPSTGTHCSAAVIDPTTSHGIDHLPDGVDPAPASLFVMPAVGLNGANIAEPKMEDLVVVQGVGLIGLGAVAASHRRGAEVVAVDLDPDRLEVASQFGADRVIDSSETDPEDAIGEMQSEGADVVFEATGISGLIDDALDLTRRDGKFVFQGDYGDRDIEFYFRTPHHNQLRAVFPVNGGLEPGRRAVLAQMKTGVLPWERAITHRFDPEEAPELYDQMADAHVDDVLGAVVDWT
jgi:threonine dehydrogenase-like Zn-dependent dehydrogenase